MKNLKSYEDLLNESKDNGKDKEMNPILKATLKKFLRNNPNNTYKSAVRHIGKAMKGWELKEVDYNKCKEECETDNKTPEKN